MNILQPRARRARTWIGRLAAVAASVLALGGLAVPAALASAGDLAFADCTGLLPDCAPVSPYNATEGPHAVAVTPDGRQLYAASVFSGAVSHFTIGRAGDLSYAGCIGEAAGCTPVTPASALDKATSLAISPDGKNLYVTAGLSFGTFGSGGAVSHFTIGRAGDLTYAGCIGTLTVPGCTPIGVPAAIVGAYALAVSPDGADLYASGAVIGTVVHFLINGSGDLGYDGCIGSAPGCTSIAQGTLASVDALAVTPDGRDLYAATFQNSAIYHFVINGYGDLGYDGCIGNPQHGCTPVTPGGAVGGAGGLLAAPGGRDLYASAANAVSHFRIDQYGNLAYAGCIGDVAGCTATSPAGALDGAHAPAVTAGGADMYVPGQGGSVVSHFRVDGTGNLAFAGCAGELAGCTGTYVIHALDGADAVTVTPDGAQLYAAGYTGDDISHFTIAG